VNPKWETSSTIGYFIAYFAIVIVVTFPLTLEFDLKILSFNDELKFSKTEANLTTTNGTALCFRTTPLLDDDRPSVRSHVMAKKGHLRKSCHGGENEWRNKNGS
jgi:hypothetical protein